MNILNNFTTARVAIIDVNSAILSANSEKSHIFKKLKTFGMPLLTLSLCVYSHVDLSIH